MRIVTPRWLPGQEAEGDAVVARVDELDARQQLAFFAGDDRVSTACLVSWSSAITPSATSAASSQGRVARGSRRTAF